MSAAPLLALDAVEKIYHRGFIARTPAFRLGADMSFDAPEIIGVMGPNGAGKTTLFEMIAGSNTPTGGHVRIAGRDIHQVRHGERDRLAIHYHQSYQVRRFARTRPGFLMQRAESRYPLVHLFDEPQFNTQDGYIGFMLEFFRRLKREGRLVFLCLHPTAPFQLEILAEICDRFLFVAGGGVTGFPDYDGIVRNDAVRAYLGALAPVATHAPVGRN
ncbi:MAG: ATP-binding cassette domain-containing protein [Phreatobacter sp.]